MTLAETCSCCDYDQTRCHGEMRAATHLQSRAPRLLPRPGRSPRPQVIPLPPLRPSPSRSLPPLSPLPKRALPRPPRSPRRRVPAPSAEPRPIAASKERRQIRASCSQNCNQLARPRLQTRWVHMLLRCTPSPQPWMDVYKYSYDARPLHNRGWTLLLLILLVLLLLLLPLVVLPPLLRLAPMQNSACDSLIRRTESTTS